MQCSFGNCFSSSLSAYRSLKKEKEEKLQVESLFPWQFIGNQLNVIPSVKAEEEQLNSVEVESHSSEGDMSENDY